MKKYIVTWFNSDLTVMFPNQSQLPQNRLQKFTYMCDELCPKDCEILRDKRQ